MEILIHMLHLEDDPADAEVVQAKLEETGLTYRVTRVQTRAEFETALRKEEPDIILADYRLPMYDGMSALRLARELDAEIPFIFVTGAMGEEAAIEALTHGATDYVLKQNLSRLPSAVNRALREARNRRQRRQAEMELKQSHNLLQTIIEAAPAAIFGMDIDGKVQTVWNSAAERMLGWSAQEVMGRLLPTVSLENQEEFSGHMELLRSGKSLDGVDARRRKRDGTLIDYTIYASPQYDAEGRIIGSITVLVDVTERKNLEKQLRQAKKMEAIGTLTGGIAHDFNNLLQVISGYSQILLLDKDSNDPDYHKLSEIQRACSRAALLVQQLLLFSRNMETEHKPANLNREVKQAGKILERTIPKMISIDLSLGNGLWTINGNSVQIEQIILNLGSNAADAMPDGGKIIIRTENVTLDKNNTRDHLWVRTDRYVLLTVSDTGHGMDKETVEHIFEPFYTTKEIGKGTGLGLASVYGIVKSHNGYINCSSEIGRGTTFQIFLPAIEQEAPVEAKDLITKPPKGGTETILIVDDEKPIRDFASQALKKFGYTLLTASTGEEAIEIYSNHSKNIDLVILDIGMPGMGGHQCLKELLKLDSKIKVIIASGYSVNGQIQKTLEAGAAGYVSKPYRLSNLLKTTRAVMEQSAI